MWRKGIKPILCAVEGLPLSFFFDGYRAKMLVAILKFVLLTVTERINVSR